MRKKVLFMIQGITDTDYMLADLLQFLDRKPFICENENSFYFYMEDHPVYDMVVALKTEKFLSRWSLFRLWDRLGDYILGNLGKVKKVRKTAMEELAKLKAQKKTVDGLFHSYGAQIGAGLPFIFEKVVMCGAPLTSSIPLVGKWSRRELKRNKLLLSERAYYFWNPEDRVCPKPVSETVIPRVMNKKRGAGHKFFNPKEPANGYLYHAATVLGL